MKTIRGWIMTTTGCAALCLSLNSSADTPAVSDVTVRQRWPWSPLVDIDYTLTCGAGQTADIAVTAYDGETRLDLPGASLSGDLFRQTGGARRIVWDPRKTAYTNDGALTRFSVGLLPSVTPLYMIVDLTNAPGTPPEIEYVYETDLVTNKWGSWVRDPVTNAGTVIQSVIWTGVTNDAQYMTSKLVLRRVTAGIYRMAGIRDVTLTKDFYVGVFEVTQEQWKNVMGNWPNSFYTNSLYRATRPTESVGCNVLRGAVTDTPPIDWPATGHAVKPSSFIGRLRDKTGIGTFDLPTEAQWEYACRAGTTTAFNDGAAEANTDAPNDVTNEWLDALGRYRHNGGWLGDGDPPRDCTPENGSAPVGSYKPNAWGLYDMHGNVYEQCLDRFSTTLEGGIDPVGFAGEATDRVRKGGGWAHPPGSCRSLSRSNIPPTSTGNWLGVRVIRNLP